MSRILYKIGRLEPSVCVSGIPVDIIHQKTSSIYIYIYMSRISFRALYGICGKAPNQILYTRNSEREYAIYMRVHHRHPASPSALYMAYVEKYQTRYPISSQILPYQTISTISSHFLPNLAISNNMHDILPYPPRSGHILMKS